MHLSADEFIGDLRRTGLRITAARRAICAVIAESHDEHLTAVDIQGKASERAGINIDQSTVYRTLDVFEDLGRLHHVHIGHGPGVIHLVEERDHHHLVCESCGKSVDVPLSEVEDVFEALGRRYGFAPTSLHFALLGTCDACARLQLDQS